VTLIVCNTAMTLFYVFMAASSNSPWARGFFAAAVAGFTASTMLKLVAMGHITP
jgi:hypothetical protein